MTFMIKSVDVYLAYQNNTIVLFLKNVHSRKAQSIFKQFPHFFCITSFHQRRSLNFLSEATDKIVVQKAMKNTNLEKQYKHLSRVRLMTT